MSVIELRAGTRIWPAAGVTDMRRGFHGLSAHPRQHLKDFTGAPRATGRCLRRLLSSLWGGAHLRGGLQGSLSGALDKAHIRRKFYDLMEACQSPVATEAVERIRALYRIEKQIRGRPAEERRAARQARARPLFEAMGAWLETSLAQVWTKSETAAAIRYALALWPALSRYLDDGRIELDNSAAERALRAVALGRKNYLFAGSDSGGERAAVFYSLIGSAKLSGLDPEIYLRHVLSRIADHPITRIEELLPWNLARSLENASRKAA